MKNKEDIDLNDENLIQNLGSMNMDMLRDMVQDNPLIPTVKGMSEYLLEKIDNGYFTDKLFDEGDRAMLEVAIKMNDGEREGINFEKEFRNFKTGHFIYGMLKSLEEMGMIQIMKYTPQPGKIEKKAQSIWNSYKRKHK